MISDKVFLAVAFVMLGIFGLYFKIDYTGWLVFIGIIIGLHV